MNIAERPFHIAHAAGAADPLIAGDAAAGPITGRKRFTFSRANRNADGSLRAVVVAAIYTSSMDVLYAEAANWPGARAGLYGPNGDVLAQAHTASRASPAFLAEVEKIALTSAEPLGNSNLDQRARGADRLVEPVQDLSRHLRRQLSDLTEA